MSKQLPLSLMLKATETDDGTNEVRLSRPTGRVIQGNAYDLISGLPDDSIDLIISSPPYWGLRTYGQDHNWEVEAEWDGKENPSYEWYRSQGGVLGLEPYPDWYVHHLIEFFDLARTKLKAGGSIWLNIGDTYF